MFSVRNLTLALGLCAAGAQAQSTLSGHFEGGGGEEGFFRVGCGDASTSNLRSLPPGFDSFVITGWNGDACKATFFCGNGDIDNASMPTIDTFNDEIPSVQHPCPDEFPYIGQFYALCNC